MGKGRQRMRRNLYLLIPMEHDPNKKVCVIARIAGTGYRVSDDMASPRAVGEPNLVYH